MESQLRLLEAIESLISLREITQARDLLARVDLQAIPDDDRGRYCLLAAEVSMHSGDYEPEAIDNALRLLRSHPDTGLFARAKHVKGWYQAATGEFLAA